jgi:hypothetical protein
VRSRATNADRLCNDLKELKGFIILVHAKNASHRSGLFPYPEERESKAPTAARVFDFFENLQRHILSLSSPTG